MLAENAPILETVDSIGTIGLALTVRRFTVYEMEASCSCLITEKDSGFPTTARKRRLRAKRPEAE